MTAYNTSNSWFELFNLGGIFFDKTTKFFQSIQRIFFIVNNNAEERVYKISLKGTPIKRQLWEKLTPEAKEEECGKDKKSYKLPQSEHHLPYIFKGATIEGDFDLSYNFFTNEDDCFKNNLPKIVHGNVYLNHNKLTTLENIDIEIFGNLYCQGNAVILSYPKNKNFKLCHDKFINK